MRNRNGGKALIIIFILILLMIAIIVGGLYIFFVTDLFKTPEQLFKKYLLSSIIEVARVNFEPFNEIKERSAEELTEYSFDIAVDTSSLSGNEEETEKYDINLTLTTDFPNKNKDFGLLVNKNEKEFLKGSIALNDKTLGLSVPDLYDKYIAVENRDLKNIAKTFELPEEYIEMIPDEIPSGLTVEEQEKINELSNKYMTKIIEQFDENNYIVEKDINIVVNSKEILSDRYTLSISSQKIYGAITNAIKELLDDPEFLSLCQDRISTEQLDKLKISYNDMLTETPVEDIEEKTLKISLYAADGKTVKIELVVDENEAYIAIDNNENESVIIFSTDEPKSDTNDIGTTSNVIIKNTYANNSGELTYESTTTYNKDDIETLQAEYDAEYSDYGEYFNTDYSEIYTDEKVKYKIKTTKSNNDTITGKVSFESEELETLKDFIDISFKCQFGKGTVTTLTEDNCEIINDYTMEDYQKLLVDIGINVATLATEKPDSLIGMFISNSDIGNSGSEDDSYYSDDYSNEDSFADDYTSEDNSVYEDIILPEDEDNNNYLYPTITDNTEIFRNDVNLAITNGLNESLNSYKTELMFNPEANLGDFLTVENVQYFCGDRYSLELIDSTTIKCTIAEEGTEYIYYALMNIDGIDLVVTEIEVLTEEEYLNR